MAITPDKAAIEAAGLEYIEPTEIVAVTGPKALNLLAQAVVDIQAKPATIDGDIPIFATLAEAEAYEAANPGRIALTIESTEPDTTPPTLGTLTITPEGTKATAVVSGASDDRGSVEYSFRLDSGAWTAWQASSTYTFTNLSLSTSYTATHRVRDRANNVVEGYATSFTTLDEDLWGTLWLDLFEGDGPLEGRSNDGLTWATPDPIKKDWWDVPDGLPATAGGMVNNPRYSESASAPVGNRAVLAYASPTGANRWAAGFGGMIQLPKTPNRVRIDITVDASSGTGIVYPALWGDGPTHVTILKPVGGAVSGARIDGGDIGTGLEVTADGTIDASLNSLGQYTYSVEGTKDEIAFYRDGKLMGSRVFADPQVWHGGAWFGFVTRQSEPNNTLNILDFSIRWE